VYFTDIMALILTYLHVISATVYAILGAVVLRLDARSWQNRILFLLLSLFSIWSVGYGVVSNPHVSRETAILFDNIAAIGWIGFPGLFFTFALFFTGRKRAVIASLAGIFIVQLLLLLSQWRGSLITGYALYWHGWMGRFQGPAALYYLCYLTLCTSAGFFLMAVYRQTVRDKIRKRQASFILVFGLIPFGLGTFFNIIARQMGLFWIPPMADVVILIWAAGITYAVNRYQFLGITTTVAADSIVSALGDALFIFSPRGAITFANSAALDLLGFSREGIEGQRFQDLVVSDFSQAAVIRDIDRYIGRSGQEALLRAKSGKEISVSIMVSEMSDYGYLCVARDISVQKNIRKELKRANELLEQKVTARTVELVAANKTLEEKVIQGKKADEERQKLESQLFQSQKLESIGQLAGGISHDFNNFLAAISGFADLIRRDKAEANERAARYAEKIVDVAGKASAMIGNLLTFARKSPVEMVVVDLHQILTDSVEILKHTLEKNITIETTYLAQNPFMLGDRVQLQNSFINLAVNARDAMIGGGMLSFETSEVALDQEFARSKSYAVVAGSYLNLTVRDTGTGMDKQTKARIFEPFFTTKEKGKGTGLGLSSVYGVVKSHGGYIEVESTLGQGTAFQIYFPSVTGSMDAQTGPAANAAVQALSGTVMVVDDEGHVHDICGEVLAELGCSVVYAANGAEAVETYRSMKGGIDLVLLDMMMPVMDGHECFRRLKEIDPAIRALIVSGYSRSEEINQTLKDGALGFVQKPFTISGLADAIGSVLKKKGAVLK